MKHKQWGQENVGNKADEICEGAINSQILFVTMPTNIFNPDHHPIDPCVAGDAAQTDATCMCLARLSSRRFRHPEKTTMGVSNTARICESADRLNCAGLGLTVELGQLLLRRTQNLDRVRHSPYSALISRTACSKGTESWEPAFALSNARMSSSSSNSSTIRSHSATGSNTALRCCFSSTTYSGCAVTM